MNAKGNCYDNAPMESFWSTLKMALVFHRHFATRKQAIQEITEFIVKRVGSGQSAVIFGRFSSPGVAPTAISIYRDFL